MKKEKTDWNLIKRMLLYLSPYKSRLWSIIVCFVLVTIVGFLQPLVIKNITDNGMMQKNMQVIIYSVLMLLGLVLIGQVLEIIQAKIFVDIHNESNFTIFHQAFNKLLHLKKEYFSEKNNAEIINFLQMDVRNVSSITDRYIVMTVSYIFRVVSGLIGLLIISPILTLAVLAMVPLKYLMVKELAKRKEKRIEEMIEYNRDFAAWFGDNIDGIDEIKLWNLYNKQYRVFKKKQGKILNNNKKVTMIDTWNMFYEMLLEWFVTGALYILGGVLICNDSLTIGGVFAFISYSGYVTGPISMIIDLRFFLSQILPSARRLFKFLDMEEENTQGDIEGINGEKIKLSFKNVSFSYDENREILKDVNLNIDKGEKIAIIGTNGSGKSTILNLLLRFYEVNSGEIQFNGESIDKLNLAEYRNLFAVVSQEPYLFLDTVMNNIDLKNEAADNRIRQASKQSGAEKFIDRLAERENSKIGRNGAKLSGGEKQKLAVARALLKDSPIVILDEATSGYDVESDSYLHDVLLSELKDKTVIMITHRYDNLEGIDRVYRLDNGQVLEVKG